MCDEDGVGGGGEPAHVQQHVYGGVLLPKTLPLKCGLECGRLFSDLMSNDTYLLLLYLLLGDKTSSLCTGYRVLLELCEEKLSSLIWNCFAGK